MAAHKIGELVEVILPVHDMNLEVAFYRDVLGLNVKDPDGVRDYRDFYEVKLATSSCTLVLHAGGKRLLDDEVPKIVFLVSDIHLSRNELLARGVAMGDIRSPTLGVLVSNGYDPEGNMFSIESRQGVPPTVGMMIETTGSTPTYVSINSRRGRSIVMLRDNKVIITTEIALLLTLLCLIPVLKALSFFSVFLIVVALLWLRGVTWNKLGLDHPKSWRGTFVNGSLFGLFFFLMQSFVIVPLFAHIVGRGPNIQMFATIHGNLPLLLTYLITTWTTSAFGEEMVFRGYLLNRLADLFGHTFWGQFVSLIIQAIAFGIVHAYQGLAGVLTAAVYGFLLGLLYLGTKRNLWPCVLAHGLNDTISFALIFLGL